MFQTTFRGAGIFNGAKDIPEMILKAKSMITHLEEMQLAGIRLQSVIWGDKAILVMEDPTVVQKFGLVHVKPKSDERESDDDLDDEEFEARRRRL